MASPEPNADSICLECGLCCNGVIFADVRLQPGDDPQRLRELGMKLRARAKPGGPGVQAQPQFRFTQPCSAHKGVCQIYADRPHYCRAFDCALLKSLDAGKVDLSKARKFVQTAHRRAEKVRKLLRQIGDNEETLSLSKRFQRIQRQVQTGPIDEETADIFGDLTLAVHDLNLLLSEVFYPGGG